MKFSAQEEYGLRCILTLARTDPSVAGGEPRESTEVVELPSLTVAEIAEREGLTVQYAGKLIRILGKAGLVQSVRGRKGGYRLARPADEISVAETLEALGGQIYRPETCKRFSGDRQYCVHTKDCSIRSLWAGLQLMLDEVLTRTSLRDLVAKESTMMAQWVESNLEATRSLADGALPVVGQTTLAGKRETRESSCNDQPGG